MKFKRLGKFRFCDYRSSWCAICIYIIFFAACFILRIPLFFGILSIVYAIIRALTIIVPHRERFVINEDSITVFLGKKTSKICLPSELTVIVSYVDVCTPLAVPIIRSNRSHILKNKIGISILKKMPIEDAFDTLHRTYMKKYTTGYIKNIFDGYRYIYSFVCDRELFDIITANRKCLLIVPESLSNILSFGSNAENMYIDVGH